MRTPGQSSSAYRWASCPVGDGRQNESRNSGHHETEQHFVDVPVDRRQAARQRSTGDKRENPNSERQRAPDAAQHKERSECNREYGRSEERRGGKEGVSTLRYRWCQETKKKNNVKNRN